MPESAPSEDEIAERVREAAGAARAEAEQLVVGEIEALEADLGEANAKAERLEAELDQTKSELEEAQSQSGQADERVTAEISRREEAEAEVSRLRAEPQRPRTEIVEPETDGPAEDGEADQQKAAIIFPAPVSPEQGPRRRRWPFGWRAGGEP